MEVALLCEPATEPPDQVLTVGRKGVERIIVLDGFGIEVHRDGKSFLIPSTNIKHIRLCNIH